MGSVPKKSKYNVSVSEREQEAKIIGGREWARAASVKLKAWWVSVSRLTHAHSRLTSHIFAFFQTIFFIKIRDFG